MTGVFLLIIACTCGVEVFSSPADGDTLVPLNAEVVVVAAWGLNAAPELRGPAGDVIDVVTTAGDDPYDRGSQWWRLRPRTELEPSTEYRIVIDGGGDRRFTTGTETDSRAPPAITATLDAEYIPSASSGCFGTCVRGDHVATMIVSVTSDASIAYYELAFEDSGLRISPPRVPLGYTNSSCSVPPPPLAPGDTPCVAVRAVTVTGQRSEPVTACATVEHCAPACHDDAPVCEPRGGGCSTAGGRASWPALLLVLAATRRRRHRT